MRVEKRPGESTDDFLLRCYRQKGGMSYHNLAKIVSDALDEDIDGKTLRQRIRQIKEDRHIDECTDDVFREYAMKQQVFRDERNAWQKQNREQIRTEQNLDMMSDMLKTIGANLFDVIEPPDTRTTKSTLLIILSDWHVGAEWHNKFGDYSPEIARQRIKTLLQKIARIQNNRCCEKAVVLTVGDMINGSIRRTVQLQNRENIIQQIRDCTELLSNFIHCLCKIFANVELYGCAGNHTRLIENKESALKDERLDSVINWATSLMLHHIKNFKYIENDDITLAEAQIYGLDVLGVHGDYDCFGRNGVQKLTAMLHKFPYCICFGHLHSPAFMEADNTFLIRGGSLGGTGDDYTIQKRIIGRPSQTVAVITPDGIESIHPIML